MTSEARTVAVTGAGGFLGRYACRSLVEHGLRVRAISSQRLASRPGLDAVSLSDPCDPVSVERALAGVDAVVHLAGAAHVMGAASSAWETFQRANVTAVDVVCRAASHVGATNVVLMSSASVVGDPGEQLVSSATPARPSSQYGRSKLEGELRAREILAATPVRVCVLRPPMVYGPGMRGNPLRLFGLVDRGIPLPLGGIRNRRSVLAAGNLVEAIRRALDAPASIDTPLYVADELAPSTPDLVRAIAAALHRPARLVPVPHRLLDGLARALETTGPLLPSSIGDRAADLRRLTGSFVVDSSDAQRVLGFAPPFSLAEGLSETAQWWRRGRPEVSP